MKRFLLLASFLLCVAGCTPLIDETALQRPTTPPSPPAVVDSEGGQLYPYEFVGIAEWFNLEAFTAVSQLSRESLRGKVVLVDFWTYSCINCIRTLPYLTSWDEKYRADGLVIVGIHSPEFSFEKDPNNVRAALQQYNITYPVGLDNDHTTWEAYENRYWPHTYLFDRDGKLVYDHIGEGGYDELERKLQDALAINQVVTEVSTPEFLRINTPEIYLGSATNRGNVAYDLPTGTRLFEFSESAARNTVELAGTWTVSEEYIVAGIDAQLRLFYHAKDIHVVAGGDGTISGEVSRKSNTVAMQNTVIDGENLYTLASTDYQDQTITVTVSPGVRLYSFTFG